MEYHSVSNFGAKFYDSKSIATNLKPSASFFEKTTADRSAAFRGGKSGQHRAPRHLTDGGLTGNGPFTASVTENNRLE